MRAEQLIEEGNLAEALKALQDVVRKDPSNAKYRVFLFQLLAVQGNWSRALNQLNVAAELDASTLPMAQTYREGLQCEALRAEIFSGKRAPLVFGEPAPWLVMLLEALHAATPEQALQLRTEAMAQAPAIAGSINGERFEWLADTDTRLGPVLEAVVNGRYYWIPFYRLQKIEIEAPLDLRDTVWTPATLTTANGGETVALIPTRYNETAASTDSALLLARRTEWNDSGFGIGQRMFATDAADYAIMDVRSIEFDECEANRSQSSEPDDDTGAEAAEPNVTE
jgi:type VI secretion system protein ImpE